MSAIWKIKLLGIIIIPLLIMSGCLAETTKEVTFTGTVMTGAQLGDVKSHCADGLYLVAEQGSYLADQTTMLLLRVPSANGTEMFSDPQFIGRKVSVTGRYPAQEVFCEALICSCEDYILLYRIEITP